MSVGNSTDATAYLGEQEILTWNKKLIPVIEVSPATTIKGDESGEITLKNTGDPV